MPDVTCACMSDILCKNSVNFNNSCYKRALVVWMSNGVK